jgi:hypothetical protein
MTSSLYTYKDKCLVNSFGKTIWCVKRPNFLQYKVTFFFGSPFLKKTTNSKIQKFPIPFLCKMLFIHLIIWCFSFMWKGKQNIVGSWIFLFLFLCCQHQWWYMVPFGLVENMLDCTPMWPIWTNKYMKFLIYRLRQL